MIAAIMLLAQAGTVEPNPPLSAMRQIKGPELERVMPDSRVEYGIPGAFEFYLFRRDGSFERFGPHIRDMGRWLIKDDLFCTVIPREICRKLFVDNRGRHYFVLYPSVLQRPWRIKLTTDAKIPALPR